MKIEGCASLRCDRLRDVTDRLGCSRDVTDRCEDKLNLKRIQINALA